MIYYAYIMICGLFLREEHHVYHRLFLQEKDLPGLKLMAGGDHLQVEVTNINILDNPDSYDWLSSGDLLLTTGYFFREDEALQRQLIRELSELNCVGLAIKHAVILMRSPRSCWRRQIVWASR